MKWLHIRIGFLQCCCVEVVANIDVVVGYVNVLYFAATDPGDVAAFIVVVAAAFDVVEIVDVVAYIVERVAKVVIVDFVIVPVVDCPNISGLFGLPEDEVIVESPLIDIVVVEGVEL